MIRFFTGNTLDKRMERDFFKECPYKHVPLYSSSFNKNSVFKNASIIYGITVEELKNVNRSGNLTNGDFDYGIITELLEISNRNPDGSKSALRYAHPFSRQSSTVRRRFFDFAIRKSVERDIDISFISNSNELFGATEQAIEDNIIQKGGIEIRVYDFGNDFEFYDFDSLKEIYCSKELDEMLKF